MICVMKESRRAGFIMRTMRVSRVVMRPSRRISVMVDRSD